MHSQYLPSRPQTQNTTYQKKVVPLFSAPQTQSFMKVLRLSTLATAPSLSLVQPKLADPETPQLLPPREGHPISAMI
jgi:hypothetical protein